MAWRGGALPPNRPGAGTICLIVPVITVALDPAGILACDRRQNADESRRQCPQIALGSMFRKTRIHQSSVMRMPPPRDRGPSGWSRLLVLLLGAWIALGTPGRAQEWQPDQSPALLDSPTLTGDWHGLRTNWAERGLSFYGDNTSFYFGNTAGGFKRDFDFGGHGDYIALVDAEKMGLAEGLSLKLRAEHRFGETLVSDAGCFFSPTIAADLPVYNSERLYLTNVLLTQKLTDTLAVFAGKFDTLDGDLNAFAHGRGKTQFSNIAFVFNPIVSATVPYSTLGAGIVLTEDDAPVAMFTVLNSTDTSGTSGFNQLFNDGVLLSASLRLPTQWGGLPGHHLFGGTWNNRTYTNLRESYVEYPSVTIPTTRGSWCLYWNADQYWAVFPGESLRGWGSFARAGIADEVTSPLSWFLSFGIGGDSPIASRPADTFGIGWYYAATSSLIGPLITAQFGPIGNGQGVECFYNYQLTPAIRLTPDLQVLVPSLTDNGTALIVGLRAQLIF